MNKDSILQSLAVIAGVLLVYLVQNFGFSNYSPFLLAILIVFSAIYISIKGKKGSNSKFFESNLPQLFGITSIVLFIISLTGNFDSSVFFFLYFCLFLLAFIARPTVILVFLASIILYFIAQAFMPSYMSGAIIPNSSNIFTTDAVVKFASLILITPIAYFIGKEFDRRSMLSQRIQGKTDEIIKEAEILKEEGELKSEANEAVDEIIEEAKSLKEDDK